MSSKTDEKSKKLSRFFKDLEEFNSEEESSEDEQNTVVNDKPSFQSYVKSQPNLDDTSKKLEDSQTEKKRLPSAHECLKSQSDPEFLKVLSKKDVDWDKFQKSLPSDESDSVVPDFKSNAVPPPVSYEPVTDPGIKVVDSEGRKRKTINDDLEDQMTSTKAYKVHPPEENK